MRVCFKEISAAVGRMVRYAHWRDGWAGDKAQPSSWKLAVVS